MAIRITYHRLTLTVVFPEGGQARLALPSGHLLHLDPHGGDWDGDHYWVKLVTGQMVRLPADGWQHEPFSLN